VYKVESWSSWFVVDTHTKRQAYSEGVREFGRGCYKHVTKATKDDIEYFKKVKGEDATIPSNY